MTIIHVIGALVAGGAERFVVSLVTTLAQSGVPVELIVLSDRRDAAGELMISELAQANVTVGIGPTKRIGWRTVVWYTRRLKTMTAPYSVHLHTPNTDLIHSLARCLAPTTAAPIVRTLHNTEPVRQIMQRIAYSHNRAVCSIACSTAVLSANQSSYINKDRPLIAISNGVEFRSPKRTSISTSDAKKNLGLSPAEIHVLAVGRMEGARIETSQKGFDVLLNAWRHGSLSNCGARLHLLGDGPLRSELAKLAENDKSIAFHGVQGQMERWLLAADIFVMPSRYEGLSIAAIEAIGCGLPAIFSDIPTFRELNAPGATYFRVDDYKALSNALVSYVSSLPSVEHQQTKAFRDRFSIARAANQYAEAYAKYGLLRWTA